MGHESPQRSHGGVPDALHLPIAGLRGSAYMALSPRIEVRQSQSLTLTPQLMQSIRLLQLSHLELNAFVEAELLRNPLLEREENEATAVEDAGEPVERPVELSAYEDTVDHGNRIQSADGIANGLDTE